MKKENDPCIHCGNCTRNCDFLKKYQLDIGNKDALKELAYHCFLCGKCAQVCPVSIDGRKEILKLRQERVKEHKGQLPVEGYDLLIKEKKDYIFRNYKNATPGSVLFPGCNFPSFYPKTTKKLSKLLKEYGIGTIYDCCGKPISELGLKKEEDELIEKLNARLKKEKIQEVIMVCPNCYYFLKGRLHVKVTSVYELFSRLQLGERVQEEQMDLFIPCPDKEEGLIYEDMKPFLPEQVRQRREIQCCGLGGCARGKEPELSAGFVEKVKNSCPEGIYTYCGSCAGKLKRDGMENVHHVLVDILGTGELPDVTRSMMNRAMSKLW